MKNTVKKNKGFDVPCKPYFSDIPFSVCSWIGELHRIKNQEHLPSTKDAIKKIPDDTKLYFSQALKFCNISADLCLNDIIENNHENIDSLSPDERRHKREFSLRLFRRLDECQTAYSFCAKNNVLNLDIEDTLILCEREILANHSFYRCCHSFVAYKLSTFDNSKIGQNKEFYWTTVKFHKLKELISNGK